MPELWAGVAGFAAAVVPSVWFGIRIGELRERQAEVTGWLTTYLRETGH